MLKIELKKIIQPILLIVVLLISVVYYHLELSFLYNYLPNGAMIEEYNYAKKWQTEFGHSMTDENFQEVHQNYQALVQEVDELIVNNPKGQERHLTSLADLEKWEESLPDGSRDELSATELKEWDVLQELTSDNRFSQVRAYQWIEEGLERLSSKENFYKDRPTKAKTKERLNQVLFEEESWRNILPESLPSTVSAHIANILILCLILMALLLPAPFVRDNLLKIKGLQWSSRKGRSLVLTQFMATQLGSFLILTLGLLVFLMPIYLTEFPRYFSSGLNSFLTESWASGEYSFLHVSFGEWIWLLILLVYLVGLSFSSVVFFIGQNSDNYLSLLMKLIPILTIFILLANMIVSRGFYIQNRLYQKTEIVYVELYLTLVIVVISLIIGILPITTSKSKDLVNT